MIIPIFYKNFSSKQEVVQALQENIDCDAKKLEVMFSLPAKETLICEAISTLITGSCTADICIEDLTVFNEVLTKQVLQSCNNNTTCIAIVEKDCDSILCDQKYFNICNSDNFLYVNKADDQAKYCNTAADKNLICTAHNNYLSQCYPVCIDTDEVYYHKYESPVFGKHQLYSIVEEVIKTRPDFFSLIEQHCNLSSEEQNMLKYYVMVEQIDSICSNC